MLYRQGRAGYRAGRTICQQILERYMPSLWSLTLSFTPRPQPESARDSVPTRGWRWGALQSGLYDLPQVL